MDRCTYCGLLEAGHDVICPHPIGDLRVGAEGEFMPYKGPPNANMPLWREGYAHGRAGQPQSRGEPLYAMGWLQGEAALEERENGYQLWGRPD